MTRNELKDLIKEVIREKNKPRIDETSSSSSTGGITSKGVTAKQSVGTATAASIIKAGGGSAASGARQGGDTTPYDFNKYLNDNARLQGKMAKV